MLTFFASAIGLAKRIPWQAYAILALLAVWYVDRTRHGNQRAYEAREEILAQWDAAKAEADAKQAESATQATVERVIETRTITIKQKARDNAIQSTNDDTPSAASNALNCERLRSAGADIQHIPACGGREDGAEAAPRP